MAKENNRTPDPRRAAMERTRVRVITAGRDEKKQLKQQQRLARQEQKMAEKLERQKTAPATQSAPTPQKKSPRPKGQSSKFPTRSLKQSGEKVKNGFQVIVGGKQKKFVRLSALAAVVLAVVILINTIVPIGMWEYVQNVFAGATGTGDGFPVAISASDRNQILSVGSDVALLGESSFQLYKSNGKQLADRQHGFANPAFTACSARVLVYDRGGKGVRLENRAKTLFSFEATGAITAATMADNGYFALVTRGGDSVSDVTVYNAKGESKFIWHSRSRQVTAASLSDNGKYLAIASVHVENGQSVTGITLFNTRKGTTLTEQEFSGSLPVSLDVKGSTALALLTDRAVSLTKSGKQNEYSYDGGSLLCFDNHNQGYAVLVLAMYQDTRNSRVVVLNKKAAVHGQSDLSGEGITVSAKGNSVLILTPDSVLFCNKKGTLKKEVSLATDATSLLCKGNRGIVLGSERLEEIRK